MPTQDSRTRADAAPGQGARAAVAAAVVGLHAAAAACFFLLDQERVRSLALALAPLLTAVALAGTTRVRRAPRAAAWYALAAGQASCASGWALWYLSPWGEAMAGDAAFVVGYVVSAAALLGIGGLGRRRARVAALDAGLLTLGLGVLAWVLVVARVTSAPDVTPAERLVSTAYPVLGVLLVALTARPLLAGDRSVRAWLLLVWTLCQGVGDAVYALTVIDGSFVFGAPVFATWFVGYAALTGAVLAPQPRHDAGALRAGSWGRRLVVVAAVLPMPVLLVHRAVEGSTRHVALVAAASVVMTVLALARGALVAHAADSAATRAVLRRSLVRSTAGFVVLALLPISGLAYVAVSEAQRAMQAEVRDRMAVTAAVSADYVREQLRGIEMLLEAYADRPLLRRAAALPPAEVQAALDPHLNALHAGHAGLFGAWFLDADGDMVSFQPAMPSVMGQRFDYRDYFTGALSREGIYVSSAYTAASVGNPRAVSVSTAVRDDSGRLLGVLVVGYRLDSLRGFAERLSSVQHVRVLIADQAGGPLAGDGHHEHGLVEAALSGRAATVRRGSGADAELASYQRVDDLGWAVVAEVDEDVALAAAGRLTARVVAAAVLLAQLLLAGLVLAVRADSRRRVAEAALGEREEHLRSVLDAAGDAYLSVDARGRITAWNERAREVFGHPAHVAVGRRVADLPLPDGAREVHRAGLARVLELAGDGTLEQRVEVEAVHADGHRFPAEVSLWTSGSASAPSYNAFVRDVTQAKAHEQALADASAAALEASRLKSEFVANMSHEIRTPMNGVLGMTSLLQETDLDDVQRDYVDTVGSCAESLLTVIDDILDFSKIEAGRLEVEAVDLELRPLVEDVVGLLGSSVAARGLEVVAWIDPQVPAFVHGDPHRLRQVLNNLVGNAVKYTERGEVVVRVQPAREGEGVRFSVRDTGIGITEEQRARLFQAFSQADASTTRKYGGTGLGLTISRQLVELMGGRLDMTSTPGVGSTFFFDLPLPEAEPPSHHPVRRQSLAGVRVLVVDDNSTNRTVLRSYLSAWDSEPTCVADAASALAELRTGVQSGRPYDVVVLDMHMPGADGLELASAVRADGALAATPMAMLTSTNQRGERAAAKAAGIGAYLTKPVRQAQLHDRLSELLGADAAEAPVAPVARAAAQRVGRVLVAEDNPVNQQVVALMLAQLGYEVDVAPDGRRAVELAGVQRYDAVLMDCQMPVLDGFAATREIRAAAGPCATTPVIALTASALASDEQRCRAAGMDDFLSKPLRREALAQTLARWTAAPVPALVPAPRSAGADDGLDHELLAEMLDLGPSFGEAVEAWITTTPASLHELARAVADGDADATARVAHALAGSGGAVGAARFVERCRDVERGAGDGAAAAAALSRLAAEHACAVTALRSAVAGDGAVTSSGVAAPASTG